MKSLEAYVQSCRHRVDLHHRPKQENSHSYIPKLVVAKDISTKLLVLPLFQSANKKKRKYTRALRYVASAASVKNSAFYFRFASNFDYCLASELLSTHTFWAPVILRSGFNTVLAKTGQLSYYRHLLPRRS